MLYRLLCFILTVTFSPGVRGAANRACIISAWVIYHMHDALALDVFLDASSAICWTKRPEAEVLKDRMVPSVFNFGAEDSYILQSCCGSHCGASH